MLKLKLKTILSLHCFFFFQGAYRPFPAASQAFALKFPYDYESITHNQPTDFAVPGKQAFTVKGAPHVIPARDKVSNKDCRFIAVLYDCDPARCAPGK